MVIKCVFAVDLQLSHGESVFYLETLLPVDMESSVSYDNVTEEYVAQVLKRRIRMEGLLVGLIVVKEVTSAAIALYNGTGIVNDCVKNYRQNRLRNQIQLDVENANERQLEWEDLVTGNSIEITFVETDSDSSDATSVGVNEREWTVVS